MSTLPTNKDAIENNLFPKLQEFILELVKRGLFEIIQNDLISFFQKSKKNELRKSENNC